MSIQETETICASNAVAPRVSLASMEAKITARFDFTAAQAVGDIQPIPDVLKLLSVCLVVMENGFVLVGKSAPASAANFNADLGKKLAYEDCIRQLWPLEGYALRDRLAA